MLTDHAFSMIQKMILQDAIQRDLPTARRAALVKILWSERYLTRAQLIARIEQQSGRGCFGGSAWEDNFYRDMRVVKQAFLAAGFHLKFSRSVQHPGYFLVGQPPLADRVRQVLQNSAAEVDPRQIEVYHRMPLSSRIRQGFSISDTARLAVVYRIRQENPGLSPQEAIRLALQRSYAS